MRIKFLASLMLVVAMLAMPHAAQADAAQVPSDEAVQALARVNAIRRLVGLEPMALEANLSRLAQGHAVYLTANDGSPVTRYPLSHGEQPGLPGFQADWNTVKGHNYISRGARPERAVDRLVGTLYHRRLFLTPDVVRFGAGVATRSNGPITVMTFARSPRTPWEAVAYPVNGQRDVPLGMIAKENPNPTPDRESSKGVGYPVTLLFHPDLSVTEARGEMHDAAGRPVEAYFSSPQAPANAAYAKSQRNTLALIPKRVLTPGTTYHVTFRAHVGQRPRTWGWSFETLHPETIHADEIDRLQALNGRFCRITGEVRRAYMRNGSLYVRLGRRTARTPEIAIVRIAPDKLPALAAMGIKGPNDLLSRRVTVLGSGEHLTPVGNVYIDLIRPEFLEVSGPLVPAK